MRKYNNEINKIIIKTIKIMNKKFTYSYNGKILTFFLNNDDYWVDATEMAIMFCSDKSEYNKVRPYRWLRSIDCKNYIDALKTTAQISGTDDVIKKVSLSGKGGSCHVWMHRRIAIRYAQWLDMNFAIWVDSKIEELMFQGRTDMNNQINQLQLENNNLQQQLTDQQPAINYYNQVLNQRNGYTTSDICYQLGLRISSKDLIKMLVDKKYMYRDKKGRPKLYSPWDSQGFQTTIYEKCSDGKIRPVTKWTEVGKQFILERALDWKLI